MTSEGRRWLSGGPQNALLTLNISWGSPSFVEVTLLSFDVGPDTVWVGKMRRHDYIIGSLSVYLVHGTRHRRRSREALYLEII